MHTIFNQFVAIWVLVKTCSGARPLNTSLFLNPSYCKMRAIVLNECILRLAGCVQLFLMKASSILQDVCTVFEKGSLGPLAPAVPRVVNLAWVLPLNSCTLPDKKIRLWLVRNECMPGLSAWLGLGPRPCHANFRSNPVQCRIFTFVGDEGMIGPWASHGTSLSSMHISGCPDLTLSNVCSNLPLLLLVRLWYSQEPHSRFQSVWDMCSTTFLSEMQYCRNSADV